MTLPGFNPNLADSYKKLGFWDVPQSFQTDFDKHIIFKRKPFLTPDQIFLWIVYASWETKKKLSTISEAIK